MGFCGADETSASNPSMSLGSSTKILKLSYDVSGKTITRLKLMLETNIPFGGGLGFGTSLNDKLLVS